MKYRLKILKKSAKVEITTLKKIDLYDINIPIKAAAGGKSCILNERHIKN